jgi:lipopolysaccharide export system permease protein
MIVRTQAAPRDALTGLGAPHALLPPRTARYRVRRPLCGLLARQALGEILQVFLAAVVGLTLLIVMAGVVREAYVRGLPLSAALLLVPYITPEVLGMTLPAGLLFAVVCVFGRMSADREIIALSTHGVRPSWVMGPTLVLACLLSVGTYGLFEVVGHWGRPNMRRVISEALSQIAQIVLTKDHHFAAPEFTIAVKRVEGDLLVKPYVHLPARAEHGDIVISAEVGAIQRRQPAQLVFVCRDGVLQIDGEFKLRFRDRFEQPLLPASNGADSFYEGTTRSRPLSEIRRMTEIEAGIVSRLEHVVRDSPPAELSPITLAELHHKRESVARLRAEPWRRWAAGFCCLSFTLLGIPVATSRGSASYLSSFMVCFLPILILYYPMIMLTENAIRAQLVPPYAIWTGNAVMIAVGLYLLRRWRLC